MEFIKEALNKSEFGALYLSNCCISFFDLEGDSRDSGFDVELPV